MDENSNHNRSVWFFSAHTILLTMSIFIPEAWKEKRSKEKQKLRKKHLML